MRPPKWTSGCSGSSTATSLTSRCAASRWSISASRPSDLDPEKIKRGYAALARMEQSLAASRFLAGEAASLADLSLVAYTRVAHEGGFHLDGYAAIRRWIGETEKVLGLPSAKQGTTMTSAASSVTIRRARRDDVVAIVKMLADDALGGPRERIEDPLPASYFAAFDRVAADPNITLVVAEGEGGAVIGCLQLCILPGLSSQGTSRGLIEDVRVDSRLRGMRIGEQLVQWAVDGGPQPRLQAGRAVDQ